MDNLWTGDVSILPACSVPTNLMFVQYTCVHPEDNQNIRYRGVAVIGFLAMLMACLLLIWTRYAMQSSKIEMLEFDVATVTAADYTVEMKIKKKAYDDWAAVERSKLGDFRPALALKR